MLNQMILEKDKHIHNNNGLIKIILSELIDLINNKIFKILFVIDQKDK